MHFASARHITIALVAFLPSCASDPGEHRTASHEAAVDEGALPPVPPPPPDACGGTETPLPAIPGKDAGASDAFSGPPVATAFVSRFDVVADDAYRGNSGNGWGGHQLRDTVHDDGTVRMLYVVGAQEGAGRGWRLMRLPPGGSWQLEAEGQTDTEAMLFRDPTTDLPHVISFVGDLPHLSSGPTFATVAIPGDWTNQRTPYKSVGVGADGTVVLQNYEDLLLDGTYSKDVDWQWAKGNWNGSQMIWGTVQKKYIGLRRSYHYLLPGAFGDPGEFVGVSLWNGKKEHTAPLVEGPYVWDGVYQGRARIDDASSLTFSWTMEHRTQPDETEAAWMAIQDSYSDRAGRLLTVHYVTDPNGPSGMYLTVSNSSGQLHQGIVAGIGGGNPRVLEDALGRLWLIEFGETANLFRVNDDFTLGEPTALDFPRYEGAARIAAPRGGNVVGDTIIGSYVTSYGEMIAFGVRLPN
jgi:hypothetical protein